MASDDHRYAANAFTFIAARLKELNEISTGIDKPAYSPKETITDGADHLIIPPSDRRQSEGLSDEEERREQEWYKRLH